jgi:Glycosyl transferases group 1
LWEEEQVKNLPNSTFCGWLDGDQLSTAYASSDIFLFPSSVETFGNVTLEAAASGLPLVVEAGCSGHLVNDGKNGFACTDEDSFFEATLKLVVDKGFRESCAAESRKHSLAFEKHAVVKQMLDNYLQVTNEFYCEYGGHHENRDRRYRAQEDTFCGGAYPRPMALRLTEYLIVVLFRIMTWLWLGFLYVVSRTLRTRNSPMPAPPKEQPIESLIILEEGNSDDAASTTASMIDASCTSLESNASISQSRASVGEAPFSHSLASGFVNFVAFSCRMESNVRIGVKSVCVPKGWRPIRKRKDSSMSRYPLDRSGCDGLERQELKRRLRRSPLPDVTLLDSP